MAACIISGAVLASEPVAVSMPVEEAVAPVVVRDLAASPPPVIASLGKPKALPEIKPAERPHVAKKSSLKKSILSRTARNQMALLAEKPQLETSLALNFFGDEDADSGNDDLDLHRSFSRPKLTQTADQDEGQDLEISEHAKLRLFLARTKAIEAYQAAQAAKSAAAADEALSENVKLRLFVARMRAVQAHQKRFS